MITIRIKSSQLSVQIDHVVGVIINLTQARLTLNESIAIIQLSNNEQLVSQHILTDSPYIEVRTFREAMKLYNSKFSNRKCMVISYITEESQYLNIMRELCDAPVRKTRNGLCRSVFCRSMRFLLIDNILPLITSKFTSTRCIMQELLWFLRGETNVKTLGNGIWNLNSSREYLDSRKLDYPEGECGPIYGKQWRHIETTDSGHETKLVDQIANVIESIKTDPYSRRHVVNSWNVADLDKMALPPCHYAFQFYVETGETSDTLSCVVNMRSADIALGVPFNIASYSILTHLIAQVCNLEAGELVINMADCHIYQDHVDTALKQVANPCHEFPTIEIPNVSSLDDICKLTVDDFKIHNYQHSGTMKYALS